jgi:hypothetical protein
MEGGSMSKVDHNNYIPTTKLVVGILGVITVMYVNAVLVEELHAPVLWIK